MPPMGLSQSGASPNSQALQQLAMLFAQFVQQMGGSDPDATQEGEMGGLPSGGQSPYSSALSSMVQPAGMR